VYPLLSEDWIRHYAEVWKDNTTAIEGTKGIDMIVEMSVSDRERAPVHIHVNGDGIIDYAGPKIEGKDPKFNLAAPAATWKKVAAKEMGVRRAVTGPIKFKGSLATALKHFKGLEAALHQFADVPTDWDA
jgi:putative sterol carrier protein